MRCEAVVQRTFTSLMVNAPEAQNCDNAERYPLFAYERTQRGRAVTSVFVIHNRNPETASIATRMATAEQKPIGPRICRATGEVVHTKMKSREIK